MTDETDVLADYLTAVGGRSFGYGPSELDCSRFVAGWLESVGRSLPDGTSDGYASAREAAGRIRDHGNLLNLGRSVADAAGLMETEAPKRGDVGIVRESGRSLFAICAGDGRWLAKTRNGFLLFEARPVKAWRITHGNGGLSAEAIGSLIMSVTATTAALGSTTVIGSLTVASIVGTIVLTAASIGISYALSSMNKPKTDPQALQEVIRQATGPRLRHYGTVKVGGTIIFSEAVGGKWYEIVVTGSGRIDAVVETWSNDKLLTLDTNGVNQTFPWGTYVTMKHRLGLDEETPYAEMMAAFPGKWTANHKLNGLSSFLKIIRDPGPKAIGKNFPGGPPKIRQVIRASLLYDPRNPAHDADDDSTWSWSDNSGLVALDYLAHPDGYGFGLSKMVHEEFAAFANLSDEQLPTKYGGIVKRYRCCGTYSFLEAHKDGLQKILATCDGRVLVRPDGRIGIAGGQYVEPTVTLDDTMILSAKVEFGRDATERANELKPIFVSPDHDFQEQEAEPWRDNASITNDGLVSQNLPLTFVPDDTQAQRLAKIAGRRMNTSRIVTLTCSVPALNAYQQETVNVSSPRLGIFGAFIVDKFSIQIEQGVPGVVLSLTKIGASDWAWDKDTEEGPPPPIPVSTETAAAIEVPQGLTAVVQPVTVSAGVTGGQIAIGWDAPDRGGLVTEVRYRRRISTSPDVFDPYTTVTVDAGQTSIVSAMIQNDGSLYEVQARHVATGGGTSEWTTVVSVTATADTTPPSVVVGLSASSPATGEISASWSTPNSANFAASRLYTNATNSLTGATLHATIYGASSSAQTRTLTGFPAGAIYVLVTAINGSGVASSSVSTSVVVL